MVGSSGKEGDESLCNLEYLLVNLGRNQATANRLIRLFLENSPALCQRLMEAVERGDRVAVKDALHDIRSSCVLFSGHCCVDLAKNFEVALRDDQRSANGGHAEWRAMAVSLCACVQSMADELGTHIDSQDQ
jgi:HPt (histidine-containing phosphotransfer) domain-containing protein